MGNKERCESLQHVKKVIVVMPAKAAWGRAPCRSILRQVWQSAVLKQVFLMPTFMAFSGKNAQT